MKHLLAILALALCLPAFAGDEDLAACKWKSGAAIEPKLCDKLRELAARDASRSAAERARYTQGQLEEERNQLIFEAQKRARSEAVAAEIAARAAREEPLRLAAAAAIAEATRDNQAAEAAHEARMAKLQKECGADFQKPRTGMSFARAKRCVGDFHLYAQDGRVSSYKAGSLLVKVADGRIVRWVVLQ